jgi:hypothetical protein
MPNETLNQSAKPTIATIAHVYRTVQQFSFYLTRDMLNPVLPRPSNLSQVSPFCLRPLYDEHNQPVTKHKFVTFEVLTAVVMKGTIVWDIMPCNPLKSTNVSEEHIACIFGVEE